MRATVGACLAVVLVLGACLPSNAPGDAGADLVPMTDVPPGDPGNGDPGMADTDIPSGLPIDCMPCAADDECGPGAKCLPVGATKHCLSDCIDDGDCPRSYTCYQAAAGGKSCLPVSYNCVACAQEHPCAAGKVCDFVSGTCKVGSGGCGKCTYDFDCDEGRRCYKTTGAATGACVEECVDTCTDRQCSTCVTTDRGVRLCIPKVPDKCGGCGGATPFVSPDCMTCWGCLNNSHCIVQGESCELTTHSCREVFIDTPPCGWRTCDDGIQGECCADADCTGCSVSTGRCLDRRCEPADLVDPCNGQCGGTSFPVCKVINSMPQCVQCDSDAQCTPIDPLCTCTGDPTFTCLRPDGSVC